tara:strand:- start:309 stop:719 length:411 start_codon:yes stop_codon:yes gene_type:complete
MATVTAAITLTSTDLLTDSLSVATSNTVTAALATVDSTSGLARKKITSTAKGTASGQVELTTAASYTSPNYLYIKNTDTTATDYISVFDDAGGDLDVLYLAGGDWAFLPIFAGANLKCYAATSGTVVEWMVFGTAA